MEYGEEYARLIESKFIVEKYVVFISVWVWIVRDCAVGFECEWLEVTDVIGWTVLVTGAGSGSIVFDIVWRLLVGGVRVIVMTSSYCMVRVQSFKWFY